MKIACIKMGGLSLVAIIGGSASAAQVDWGLQLGVDADRTNNFFREQTAPLDSTIETLYSRLDVRAKGSRLDLDLQAGVQRHKFDVDGIADQTIPNLNVYAAAELIEERLSWVFMDQFSQVGLYANGALYLSDRQNVNLVSTGPDFHLSLGDGYALAISGRVGRAEYETSPIDSDRFAGSAALERALADGSAVTLQLKQAATDYQDSAPSLDVTSLLFGYRANGARTRLDLDFGGSQLHSSGRSRNGFVLDASVERTVSQSSRLGVNVSYRLADSADVFSRDADLDPSVQTVQNVLLRAGGMRQSAINLSYGWSGRRTTAIFRSGYFEERYLDGLPGSRLNGYEALLSANLKITTKSQLSFTTGRRSSDRAILGRYNEDSLGLGMELNIGRNGGIRAGADYFSGHGLGTNSYDELRYSLGLVWYPHRLDQSALAAAYDTPASRRNSSPRR